MTILSLENQRLTGAPSAPPEASPPIEASVPSAGASHVAQSDVDEDTPPLWVLLLLPIAVILLPAGLAARAVVARIRK